MDTLLDNAWTVGLVMFACLFGSAVLSLLLHRRLPEPSLSKETQDVMKLGVGMIIAMSTLVLGLMTASVKGEFDAVNTDIKTFATEIVLLDRTLHNYGAAAETPRQDLIRYTRRALSQTWPAAGQPAQVDDDVAEVLLDRVEQQISALVPATATETAQKTIAAAGIESIIQQRWKLIEEANNSISPVMVGVLIFWLSITFASFGYNAPRNVMVVMVFFLCAASIGGAIFLILELDGPFDGLVKVSSQPMQVTLDHMLNHRSTPLALPPG